MDTLLNWEKNRRKPPSQYRPAIAALDPMHPRTHRRSRGDHDRIWPLAVRQLPKRGAAKADLHREASPTTGNDPLRTFGNLGIAWSMPTRYQQLRQAVVRLSWSADEQHAYLESILASVSGVGSGVG